MWADFTRPHKQRPQFPIISRVTIANSNLCEFAARVFLFVISKRLLNCVAIRIAFPNVHHPFRVALYGFPTLPVVSRDMGSTYLGTPEFDYLGHRDLLKHHGALRFALLQQLSVPAGVSKYLSYIRDEESAISNPWFQGRHEFPPRRLIGPPAFLCSHIDVTPGGKSNKGILEGVGVKATAYAGGTHIISAGIDAFAHAVAQSLANFFQFIEGVRGMRNTSSMGTTKKSLAQTHPALAKEAHGWDPSEFIAGSAQKKSWKCALGHTWEQVIRDRIRKNSKGLCPICNGKTLLVGFNDLATTNPDLITSVDGWDPQSVTNGSVRKMGWRCTSGHQWMATVHARARLKRGCPYCAHVILLTGFNDLKTHFPEIAAEADGWDPSLVITGSKSMRRWKCKEGHSWRTTVNVRCSRQTKCNYCNGRLVDKGHNDLATTHPKLALEADGWDPSTVVAGSQREVQWKCELGHTWITTVSSRAKLGRGCGTCSGMRVLNGFNDLATTHPDIAKKMIDANPKEFSAGSDRRVKWQCDLGHIWEASVKHVASNGRGCPYCANYKVLAGFNDFATKHPLMALEADGWDPSTVVGGSAVFKNWKCEKGHKYSAKVSSRDASGSGCPYCANQQVLEGFNDLATTHPELALQADGWDPTTVVSSNKSVNWICPFGHKTKASISVRKMGSGCRVCANQEVLFGFNDLKTKYPLIASEAFGWNPETVLSKSSKHQIWKCSEGHTWKATVASRTGLGAGCPTCAPGGGFDPNQDGYLYFLKHESWNMFQIGITNIPRDRLGRHSKLGWELIELRGPMDGHLTHEWETAILRMLKAKGADLSNAEIAGKFDGYSEAWSMSTFVSSSIKELMRLTEEFEEK